MSTQPRLRVLFNRAEIEAAVDRLAAEINRDYHGRCPVLIGVLKGSFMFMADLVRKLDSPVEVDFIGASSYGCSKQTSGRVKVTQGLRCPIKGRDVLVVEDIVDTGLTLSILLSYLRRKKPASLRLCALLDKPSRRQVPVDIDYLGHAIPDEFVVGYGLDWAESLRNLPDICVVEEAQ